MNEIFDSKILKEQEVHRKWVEGLLVSAQKRKWFGTITIEIKRGMISMARCEETLKPPVENLPPKIS